MSPARFPRSPAWVGAVLLAAVWCFTGCDRLTPEARVQRLGEDFYQTFLAFSPVTATATGYHNHQGVVLDDLLDDMSPRAMDGRRAFFNQAHAQFDDLAVRHLSPESRADVDVVRRVCEAQLLELDRIQEYRHNPTLYVETVGNAIDTPFLLAYAPPAERFAHIINRLRKVPDYLNQAKQNLSDSPEIWTKVAEAENNGNIELIDRQVRAKVPPALKVPYAAAAAAALTALRSFNGFLADDLAKRSVDWRLGADQYALKLRATLTSGDSPDVLLAAAEAKLESTRAEMGAQAAGLYPRLFPGRRPPSNGNALLKAVLDKIAGTHATPAAYLDEARHDLAEASEFVANHHLMALPGRPNLQVIPTPEFMRGLYAVGGFSPAPVLEPQMGAFYWVTPVTADMTPDQVESKLREYNFWGLKILTIHEAMPGHYVQAEYASDVQPPWRAALRSIFADGPYVEGWAVYATQLLIEQGYQDTPEMRLTFGKQMLRVISNTILDIKLQTRRMTDQEALDFMINDTFQEREEAVKKLQRAKLSSCQLPTYFVGWQGWLALRAGVQEREGAAFKLASFHERALKEGPLPLPLLRSIVLPPPPQKSKDQN